MNEVKEKYRRFSILMNLKRSIRRFSTHMKLKHPPCALVSGARAVSNIV
jgi:hypothetical protein